MNKPIIIIGGGLWGGLLAYRWQQLHPQIDILLVEENGSFGGNHTWSFHDSDLDEASHNWIKPFITKTWTGYEVKFPQYSRTLPLKYHSISSEKFHQVLKISLRPESFILGQRLELEVALEKSPWIIDARGLFEVKDKGYQKFMGLEVQLEDSHGLHHPILMDARVPQTDGFRFIYYLPFSSHQLLIEDTRYSSSSDLDDEELRNEIFSIAKENGWKITSILREEKGVLPIPISETTTTLLPNVVNLGGIFHDTTGYSLPDAVKFIDRVLGEQPSFERFQEVIQKYRQERKSQRGFYRLLNRFMFRCSGDDDRYKMLEFFYKKKPDIISRFYSGQMTTLDYLKFFLGKPPISILKAFQEVRK